jgi:hypothetical protein
MKVKRDKAKVEQEYGLEKWPHIQRALEKAIAAGESDLARLVAAANNAIQPDVVTLLPSASHQSTSFGQLVSLPASLAFAGRDAFVAAEVRSACREDTDLIVELGSGWGRNLANVWLSGGPRSARYISGEFTAAGRAAAELMGRACPAFPLSTLPVDFYNLPAESLPRSERHAVVFTHQSIEQIPQLPRAALEVLLTIAPQVSCINMEPIGWQLPNTIPGAGNSHAFSQDYSEQHDYNRNLWTTLKAIEADGLISVLSAERDVFGCSGSVVSIVRWTKRQ